MNILWFIIIGGVAGWLAGVILKGRGFGMLGNILVGIVGALIGGWVIDRLWTFPGVSAINLLGRALVGALILLLIIGAVKKTNRSS